MQHPAELSPLGKHSAYVSHYDASLLYPIAREIKWAAMGLEAEQLPYVGEDIWNCYELSWLMPTGKPCVAMMSVRVPANSPNIIESKSFKLYLNSFNQSVFASTEQLQQVLEQDLSATVGAPVQVTISSLSEAAAAGLQQLAGECIDQLDITVADYYAPAPELLRCQSEAQVETALHSHLLKSNCPVTGQPDWGSVEVVYRGKELDQASFLAYLVSYRQCQDFHEQCAERIFIDLYRLLQPEYLRVTARYLRRGGIDINPVRCTHAEAFANPRLVRQ